MKRSSLVPLAALSMLVLIAPRAHASGIPSAVNSTVPAMIRLVGSNGVAPDAVAGQFTVVARTLSNNPINGCTIVLDLSGCPDLVLCADQMDPNALINCTAKSVRKFANVQGAVTFTVLGSSTGAGRAVSLAGSARIYGNGALMALPSVASFDLDGSGGVGAEDLSVWFGDFATGQPYERSDFDGSGAIGANDLSAWLDVFGAGGSVQSCGASCPFPFSRRSRSPARTASATPWCPVPRTPRPRRSSGSSAARPTPPMRRQGRSWWSYGISRTTPGPAQPSCWISLSAPTP
jgi:hypothetical protein